MSSFGDIQVTKVGNAGLVLLPSDKTQSPWIQNLTMETDGSWRPRWGLRLLRDFGAYRICGLGSCYQPLSSLQRHVLYVATEESKLYTGSINQIGADTAATYPSGAGELPTSVWSGNLKNAVFAVGTSTNPTASEKKAVFAWPGVSNYDNPKVWEQDATTLNDSGDIEGVPFAHGNTLCVIQNDALKWSTYGDAYTWPASNETILPPEMGRGVGGCYWQEDVSYLFGDAGVVLAQGSPLEQSLRFRVLNAPPAAGGSGACITKARDRIYYLSPGPNIFMVGGGLQNVSDPINYLLRSYGDISNYQMFYDPIIDSLCVAPYVSGGPNYTYMFNVSQNKWTGVYVFADSTKSISKATNAGPLSDSDTTYKNAQPHGAVVVAVGALLSYYDPSLYTDETASATYTAFTCALETAPEGANESPPLLKRLNSVYVDGTGTWTVKLKYRTGGGSYTTATIGSVAAPGWVHAALDTTAYQERIVRVEASSSSSLKLKSLTIKEMLLGG